MDEWIKLVPKRTIYNTRLTRSGPCVGDETLKLKTTNNLQH